ncbi:MAG: MarR family transcriptional regulator [Bacteroidota bacterium]
MHALPRYTGPHHRLRATLLRTASWMKEEFDTFLAPHGLTQPQFNVLRILRGQERLAPGVPLSTKCIRERMLDRGSDTSRLVARLEGRGLVAKHPSDADRRRVVVELTEAGHALLSVIDAQVAGLDAVTQALSDEDATRIANLLDQLGPDQLGPEQLGPEQLGPEQLGPEQIGPEQIGPEQPGRVQPGPEQPGRER